MRHVRTEEGSRFFNMPIGSPITLHLIQVITRRNKVAGILPNLKSGDMLADDPLHVDEVRKAADAGSRTVNLGPNIPLSTHPTGDHERTLNNLSPGTHVFHVTGSGRYHEHVKNADGSWEEHMPGQGGSLGHSASASEIGKSISGADSATVTHVPQSEAAGQKAVNSWFGRGKKTAQDGFPAKSKDGLEPERVLDAARRSDSKQYGSDQQRADMANARPAASSASTPKYSGKSNAASSEADAVKKDDAFLSKFKDMPDGAKTAAKASWADMRKSDAAKNSGDLEKESAKLREYYKTAKTPLGSSIPITPPGNGDAAAHIVHTSPDGTKFQIPGLGTFTKGTDGKRWNGKSNVTYTSEKGRDFGFQSMDFHARHGDVSKVEGQVADSKGNSVSVQDKVNEKAASANKAKALLQPAPKEPTPKAPARVPVPLSFRPGKPITADVITGAKDGDVVHAVSPYGGTQRYVYSAKANGWHTPDNPQFAYPSETMVKDAKAGKLFDGDPDARAQRLLPEELDAAKHGDQVSVDDRYTDRKNYTFNANKKQWEGPRGEVLTHAEMKAAADRWYVHQGAAK